MNQHDTKNYQYTRTDGNYNQHQVLGVVQVLIWPGESFSVSANVRFQMLDKCDVF